MELTTPSSSKLAFQQLQITRTGKRYKISTQSILSKKKVIKGPLNQPLNFLSNCFSIFYTLLIPQFILYKFSRKNQSSLNILEKRKWRLLVFSINSITLLRQTEFKPSIFLIVTACKQSTRKIKIPEWRQWRRSGIFAVNFGYILHFLLLFLLLTLNSYIFSVNLFMISTEKGALKIAFHFCINWTVHLIIINFLHLLFLLHLFFCHPFDNGGLIF